MFKKLATAVTAASLIALAGCGSTDDAQTAQNSSDDQTPTQQGEKAQKDEGKPTGDVWSGTGDFGEKYTIDLSDIKDDLPDVGDDLTKRTQKILDDSMEFEKEHGDHEEFDDGDGEGQLDFGWLQMDVDNSEGSETVDLDYSSITVVMDDGEQAVMFPGVLDVFGDMTEDYFDMDNFDDGNGDIGDEYNDQVHLHNDWLDRQKETTYKPGAKGPREVMVMDPDVIDPSEVESIWVDETELTN